MIKNNRITLTLLLTILILILIILSTLTSVVALASREKYKESIPDTPVSEIKIVDDPCMKFYLSKDLRYKSKVGSEASQKLDTAFKATVSALAAFITVAGVGAGVCAPFSFGFIAIPLAPIVATAGIVGTTLTTIPFIVSKADKERIYSIRKVTNLHNMIKGGSIIFSHQEMKKFHSNAKDPARQVENFIEKVKKNLSINLKKVSTLKKSKQHTNKTVLMNKENRFSELSELLNKSNQEEFRELVKKVITTSPDTLFCQGASMKSDDEKRWHHYLNYNKTINAVANEIRSIYGLKSIKN
ncbi:MAG: hypothetical protein HQK49_19960 [Oligoflexia bacterium]|nr:hypothetical protein [Oligoflexia bacterium]